jgi:hypothetical protein
MKFCPVVPEICRGHVHVAKKQRRRIIIIIISNGAKTISLQTTFGKLNYSCHMKSCLFSAKKNPFTPFPPPPPPKRKLKNIQHKI